MLSNKDFGAERIHLLADCIPGCRSKEPRDVGWSQAKALYVISKMLQSTLKSIWGHVQEGEKKKKKPFCLMPEMQCKIKAWITLQVFVSDVLHIWITLFTWVKNKDLMLKILHVCSWRLRQTKQRQPWAALFWFSCNFFQSSTQFHQD